MTLRRDEIAYLGEERCYCGHLRSLLVAKMRITREPTPALIEIAQKENVRVLAGQGATEIVEHFPPERVDDPGRRLTYWTLETTAWVTEVAAS